MACLSLNSMALASFVQCGRVTGMLSIGRSGTFRSLFTGDQSRILCPNIAALALQPLTGSLTAGRPRPRSRNIHAGGSLRRSTRGGNRGRHETKGQLSRQERLNGDLSETERLQKFLSRCGICSRRVAEDHIVDGRVAINGKVTRELGVKVNVDKDSVTFDGQVVELPEGEPIWLAMHKPRGVISTVRDEKDRATVITLLSETEQDARLLPVGRLDRDTSGLLLMTNDYPWINTLTHPSFEHEKSYLVDVMGTPSHRIIAELQAGVNLPDEERMTLPTQINVLGRGERALRSEYVRVTRLEIIMREGRKHQIRNMMEYVGHPVVRLHRVAFGGIGIGGLRRATRSGSDLDINRWHLHRECHLTKTCLRIHEEQCECDEYEFSFDLLALLPMRVYDTDTDTLMFSAASTDVNSEERRENGETSHRKCNDKSLAKMSVASIRLELSRRGVSVFGTKSDLVERLKVALQRERKVSVPSRMPNLFGMTYTSRKRTHNSPFVSSSKRPRQRAKGYLRGHSVWVVDREHMMTLFSFSHGFGKGSLSRSTPSYALDSISKDDYGRAARQLKALELTNEPDENAAEARSKLEHLQLNLCEAFYAAYILNIMEISTIEGTVKSESECWDYCCSKTQGCFPYEFAAYHKYRATGWLPRSGLKYGVDWVLYPRGIKHHVHSSYCVILNYQARGDESSMERSWMGLQSRLRTVKNVAKTLVVASIDFVSDEYSGAATLPQNAQQASETVQVTEVTIDRWIP